MAVGLKRTAKSSLLAHMHKNTRANQSNEEVDLKESEGILKK